MDCKVDLGDGSLVLQIAQGGIRLSLARDGRSGHGGGGGRGWEGEPRMRDGEGEWDEREEEEEKKE